MSVNSQIEEQLQSVYEEVMWLAQRPHVSASMARAWYTHIVGRRMASRLRLFSGQVSSSAASNPGEVLRLEHHQRIQTTLTSLVSRHITSGTFDPSEFIETVVRCESVHIVTFRENYDALKAKGDYALAGIVLVPWDELPNDSRELLWTKMLKGRVANASSYRPML